MNQVMDPELQTAQQEKSTEVNLSILRLQMTYRLVLTGTLAVVAIIAMIVVLLWLLPGGLPIIATLALATSAIGIIGTLVGAAVGLLLGSMGKEQSDKQAEKALTLLLESLQKRHELNGISPL